MQTRPLLRVATALSLALALASQDTQAQGLPPLCPQNMSPESWDNCFGQYRDPASQTLYSGQFSRGQFGGFGVLITPDGQYSGQFRNGKFEGEGILLLSDGVRYLGGFRAGMMEGQGRIVNVDGREITGTFSQNNLVTAAGNAQRAAQPAAPVVPVAPPAPPAPRVPPPPPAARAPAAAALIPSRQWDCSTGYYPNVSYSSLVTSGNSYTTSWRDGSGAKKGTFSRGTFPSAMGGVSIAWDSGTWADFKGEYVPAGAVHPTTGKVATSDSVNVALKDSTYWPTSCNPK